MADYLRFPAHERAMVQSLAFCVMPPTVLLEATTTKSVRG